MAEVQRVKLASYQTPLDKTTDCQYTCGMFEWDLAKEQQNIIKHRLDFRTASRVFLDPLLIELEDDRHEDEIRWNVIGVVDGRVLFVTYTERNGRIRIISARGAEPHERKKYHNLF
ncbi:MAG: BrnT family toxin [Caldilineaceae bacterium]